MYLGMEIYPNVAVAVYGATGDGKTTATRHGIDRLQHLDDHVGVLRGSGSGEGVVDWLKDAKASHLWYAEEYSEILIRAGWDGATLKSVITSLFDCPPAFELKFKKDKVATVIPEPTLSLLVCTTPATFWRHLREEDMEAGFGNRWIYLRGEKRPTISRPTRPDSTLLVPVEATLARLITIPPTECRFSRDAEILWDEFFLAWDAERWSELTALAAKRIPQYVLKLGMLYAALEGTLPELTADQLTAAILVGNYAVGCTDYLMRDARPGGFRSRLENRILGVLADAPLPTYRIKRQVGGGVSVEDVDRAIRVFERAGEIEIVAKTQHGRSVWGRVGVTYGK
jgi:hypothetical protein